MDILLQELARSAPPRRGAHKSYAQIVFAGIPLIPKNYDGSLVWVRYLVTTIILRSIRDLLTNHQVVSSGWSSSGGGNPPSSTSPVTTRMGFPKNCTETKQFSFSLIFLSGLTCSSSILLFVSRVFLLGRYFRIFLL